MSWCIWLGILLIKYASLFSLNSLVLGVLMFVCSLLISMLMSIYSLSWYSLMFFMVYMGGLLVLLIYMSSLKFNPVFYFSKVSMFSSFFLKINILFFFMLVLTQITWNFKGLSWGKSKMNKFSLSLFKEVEVLFLINVGILLLMVLWVMTKLSFQNRGALRPFFW